jgi:ZIP family zinc transporter
LQLPLKLGKIEAMSLTIILLAFSTFISTLAGGYVALKNKKHINRILGYTAGVLLGVVAFELLPEIFDILQNIHASPTGAMIALVCGFLALHIVEKSILIHHTKDEDYPVHKHPHVGVASAVALIGHSLLDGIGIGLAFQASTAIGVAVAIAVIAHDFTDGLNTVNLMLVNKNKTTKTIVFLVLDALAPVVGALSTMLFSIPDNLLVIYLGFFTGFLLYIGSSEILPEAHSKNSSYKTIMLTVLGVVFMYLISLTA